MRQNEVQGDSGPQEFNTYLISSFRFILSFFISFYSYALFEHSCSMSESQDSFVPPIPPALSDTDVYAYILTRNDNQYQLCTPCKAHMRCNQCDRVLHHATLCGCQHIYCQFCSQSFLGGCRVCRESSIAPVQIEIPSLDDLEYKCMNCEIVVGYKDIDEHVCLVEVCPNKGCLENYHRSKAGIHRDVCWYTPISCNDEYKEAFKRLRIEDVLLGLHYKELRPQLEHPPSCSWTGLRKDHAAHSITGCAWNTVYSKWNQHVMDTFQDSQLTSVVTPQQLKDMPDLYTMVPLEALECTRRVYTSDTVKPHVLAELECNYRICATYIHHPTLHVIQEIQYTIWKRKTPEKTEEMMDDFQSQTVSTSIKPIAYIDLT
jgi:hypothetical protein